MGNSPSAISPHTKPRDENQTHDRYNHDSPSLNQNPRPNSRQNSPCPSSNPTPSMSSSHQEYAEFPEINHTQGDVSMTDVNAPVKRKSTLILTDDLEFDKLKLAHQNAAPSQASPDVNMNDEPAPAAPIPSQTQPIPPTEIKWVQGGEKVYVTGSFTGWRKMIGLVRLPDGSFSIKLALPPGTHRFRFVVDNELRFSDVLPTATDQMGNFVNYIEVASWAAPTPVHAQPSSADLRTKKLRSADSKLGLTQDDDDMGGGYTRYHDESHVQLAPPHDYTHHIPAIFTDPKVMEQYYLTLDQQQRGGQQQWLIPPQLPPHLENVILNNYSGNDSGSAGLQNISGALPIPNHVVLNHLATTSIKHNTLAVASIVRYKQKYSTQILYAPLQ